MSRLETQAGASIPAAPDLSRRFDHQAFLAAIPDDRIRAEVACLDRKKHDLERLFPKTEGWGAKTDIKRRLRMLKSISPHLEHLLYPGERIEFVTNGVLNSFAEQYCMGWFAFILNQTLFVFTNYRVILLHATSKGEAKTMMWQIPYDQITKFTPGNLVSATVVFKLADGKSYRFTHIPRGDRRALRSYVAEQRERVASEAFQFPHFQCRDALCPQCASPVQPKARHCGECTTPFLNPYTAGWLSALAPGVGDLYLGHWVMAIFELIGTAFLWLLVGATLFGGGLEAAPIAGLILVGYHAWDAIITLHVAKKGVLRQADAWKAG
jgi:hypothetical protein